MRVVVCAVSMIVVLGSCAWRFNEEPDDDDDDGFSIGEGEGEPEPGCTIDRDCGTGHVCDKTNDGDRIPAADDPEGVCVLVECVCDGRPIPCANRSRCDEARCFDNDDCEDGDICRIVAGEASCGVALIVTPRDLLVSRGVAIAGERIDTMLWATDDRDRLASTAVEVVEAVCASGVCEQRIEQPGVLAIVRVHAKATAQQVIVADTQGRPIVGARVRTGTGDVDVDGVTDDDGVFVYNGAADFISVVKDGFEGHTFMAPADNVLVVLRALDRQVLGASFDVDFANTTSFGDVRFSIANTPLNGDPSAFSLRDVFGASSAVIVDVQGLTEVGGQRTPLLDGAILGLGDDTFRGRGVVVGDDNGSGRLLVWSLAARLQLSTIGPTWVELLERNSDVGPDFTFVGNGRFEHGLTVLEGLEAQPYVPADDDDLDGIEDAPPTTTGFADTTLSPDTVQWSSVVVDAADLQPTLAIPGVEVPGLGFVPLGLAEHSRDDVERTVDHAPPHDGFERLAVKTIIAAYDERPWSSSQAVRLRTRGDFVPEASGAVSVADNAVVIGAIAGASLFQVRVVADGYAWNFWSRTSARIVLNRVLTAPMPEAHEATVISHRRDDDADDRQIVDGQLGHLTGLTRAPIR